MEHTRECQSHRLIGRKRGRCDCPVSTGQGFKNEYRVVDQLGVQCFPHDPVFEDRDFAEDTARHRDLNHETVCGTHQVQTRVVSDWLQLKLEGVDRG